MRKENQEEPFIANWSFVICAQLLQVLLDQGMTHEALPSNFLAFVAFGSKLNIIEIWGFCI